MNSSRLFVNLRTPSDFLDDASPALKLTFVLGRYAVPTHVPMNVMLYSAPPIGA